MSRLRLEDSELFEKLKILDEFKLRELSKIASKFIVQESNIKDPLIDKAFKYFDEPEDRAYIQNKLKELIEKLDQIYWDKQEQREKGKASEQEESEAFRKARAVNSLYYALDVDPLKAAEESIYEAVSGTNDYDGLKKSLLVILNK